jgi:D-sedoheptulose 7-phosphate isomerase
MFNSEEYLRNLIANQLESQMSLAEYLPEQIAQFAMKMVQCLLEDGKILIAANGASLANGLHFSHALIHQYMVERPALPALVLGQDMTLLSTSANRGDYAQIFARQIHALGHEKDLLLVLTTNGDSTSLIHAIDAAKERGMDVVMLNGPNPGILSNHLGPEDLELRINLDHPARIRETHLFILHCLCDLIDQALFGANSS